MTACVELLGVVERTMHIVPDVDRCHVVRLHRIAALLSQLAHALFHAAKGFVEIAYLFLYTNIQNVVIIRLNVQDFEYNFHVYFSRTRFLEFSAAAFVAVAAASSGPSLIFRNDALEACTALRADTLA